MKKAITFLLAACFLLALAHAPGCGSAKPTAVTEEQKFVIADLLTLAGKIARPEETLPAAMHLLENGESGPRGTQSLARYYLTGGQCGKAFEESSRLLTMADPGPRLGHAGLGDLYYDLALLDIMNRGLFTQTPLGFFFLKPDMRTRLVFAAAKIEFDEGLRDDKDISQERRNRLAQLQSYLDGASTASINTIDQSKCASWLAALSTQRPELMRAALRGAKSFQWQMFLSKQPSMSPQQDEFRKKRESEIESVFGEDSLRVLSICNLACMVSYWTSLHDMYAQAGASGAELLNNIKEFGTDIEKGCYLLEIPLTEQDKAELQGAFKPNGLKSLLAAIEKGLSDNYSPRCRSLFVLIAQEYSVAMYTTSKEMIEAMGAKLAPVYIKSMVGIAREAGADDATLKEIAALAEEKVTTTTGDKFMAITSCVSSKLIADMKKRDQWYK